MASAQGSQPYRLHVPIVLKYESLNFPESSAPVQELLYLYLYLYLTGVYTMTSCCNNMDNFKFTDQLFAG
jgi:hypothetical protein